MSAVSLEVWGIVLVVALVVIPVLANSYFSYSRWRTDRENAVEPRSHPPLSERFASRELVEELRIKQESLKDRQIADREFLISQQKESASRCYKYIDTKVEKQREEDRRERKEIRDDLKGINTRLGTLNSNVASLATKLEM